MTDPKNPLVSIALCTYNGERFLKEQLESLVNQSYANIEIIAVDDCSSDGTIAILENCRKQYSNLKIFKNDRNLGYIKNFEKAIGLCQGEYIALCDQDDVWDLEKIQKQLKSLGNNILIYHDSQLMNGAGESLGKKMSDMRNFYAGKDSRALLIENCVSGHSILFKKELIPYALPIPPSIFHDWWLAYVAGNIGRIDYLEDCLVNYRQHEETHTDILNQKTPDRIKKENMIIKLAQRVELFSRLPQNQHQDFKNRLYSLLNSAIHQKWNFRLALFVFFNRDTLLFIKKKSFWSKLNYCRKLI